MTTAHVRNTDESHGLLPMEQSEFYVGATNRRQALEIMRKHLPNASIDARLKSALIAMSKVEGVNPTELYKILCARLNLSDIAQCKSPVERALLLDPVARKSVAMAVGLASVGGIIPNLMDKATSDLTTNQYGVFPVSFAIKYRSNNAKLSVDRPDRAAIQSHGMFGNQSWTKQTFPAAAPWVSFLEPTAIPYGFVVVKPLFEIVAAAWQSWLNEASYVAK